MFGDAMVEAHQNFQGIVVYCLPLFHDFRETIQDVNVGDAVVSVDWIFDSFCSRPDGTPPSKEKLPDG